MSKSYAFIGTSYLYACEDHYRSAIFNDNNNPRFDYETNLIQAVSKRNPNNTIYNCSEDGHGIETYYKRILELLKRYDPDEFVIEIPQGERMLAHTNEEYLEHYDLYFPVQIWENGFPQNINEPFRKTSSARIDSCQVLMTQDELNKYWSKHTDMPFHLGEKQWQGYKRVLSNLNTGRVSRYSDVIAQCEIISGFLLSKGKKVHFFNWSPPLPDWIASFWPNGNPPLEQKWSPPTKLNLLNPNNIYRWTYERDLGEFKNYRLEHNHYLKAIEYFKKFTYDDNSHLKSKYMPEFAPYFDEIFK